MRLTERGERYVVYDDFLPPEEFERAVELMERSSLAETQSVISPEGDGPARRSRGMSFAASIGDGVISGRPPVFTSVAQAVREETTVFGMAGVDWDKLTFTFWQYPVDSRLGWHNDAGRGRRGEFIVYLHREWDISWGGELLLIDREPRTLLEALRRVRGHGQGGRTAGRAQRDPAHLRGQSIGRAATAQPSGDGEVEYRAHRTPR